MENITIYNNVGEMICDDAFVPASWECYLDYMDDFDLMEPVYERSMETLRVTVERYIATMETFTVKKTKSLPAQMTMEEYRSFQKGEYKPVSRSKSNPRPSNRRERRGRPQTSIPINNTLILKNLPYHQTFTYSLMDKFEPYGKLKHIKVLRNQDKSCKGLAFVEFERKEDATKALKENGSRYEGRRIGVEYARPHKPHNKY
jgi:hypothetical protein